MKLTTSITRLSIAALGLMAIGLLSVPNTVKADSVQPAQNIYQMPDYSERSNAFINTYGVKGVENGNYLEGNDTPKSYQVTTGTQAGSQWHTAFYLSKYDITSSNNPSGKSQRYIANDAPQGFTIDDAGNMYFALSQRSQSHTTSGYLYTGYIMRLDKTAISQLIKDPTLMRKNPNALGNHIRFSNNIPHFSSGAFAYDPYTQKIKFIVAYDYGNLTADQFLAKRPVQLVTVDPTSLALQKTDHFYLHDAGSGHYLNPSTLAFDRDGNFYSVAAARLTTTNGDAYLLTQGTRQGNSYKVHEMGMSIKPILAKQLQGISIDHNRLYIASNSAYLSLDLSAYLEHANTPSTAATANNWMKLEVNQLAGNREAENTVSSQGVTYMMMTTPNEVVMNKVPSAPSNNTDNTGKIEAYKGIVKIYYVPGYGIAIWRNPGQNPLSKKLAHGTSWLVFAKTTVNGQTWYNLGGDQWISGQYAYPIGTNSSTEVMKKKVVTINYVPGYGISVWTSPYSGKKIPGKILKHGTKWQTYGSVDKGELWYDLGGNQWIQARYTK